MRNAPNNLIGCAIYLRGVISYMVAAEHYEYVKNLIETRTGGWVELTSVHGDGKLFCQVDQISELFLSTPGYVAARAEADQENYSG